MTTTPRRTAFDLARWAPDRVERVVALDALANAGRFDPTEVLALRDRHPRASGAAGLPEAVRAANRFAGSPPETRVRLALVAAGLPAPEVQWVVQDAVGRRMLRFTRWDSPGRIAAVVRDTMSTSAVQA